MAASRPYRESTVPAANNRPNRSFTGSSRFCLQPRYRSMVRTDACPRKNWICSISPPAVWHSFAQVLRRSCGARWSSCIRSAHLRTTYQMTFSEIPLPKASHGGSPNLQQLHLPFLGAEPVLAGRPTDFPSAELAPTSRSQAYSCLRLSVCCCYWRYLSEGCNHFDIRESHICRPRGLLNRGKC